jgi:hypothetical protein
MYTLRRVERNSRKRKLESSIAELRARIKQMERELVNEFGDESSADSSMSSFCIGDEEDGGAFEHGMPSDSKNNRNTRDNALGDDHRQQLVNFWPDASSLDLQTAQKLLSKIFRNTLPQQGEGEERKVPEFPTEHALFLLRAHPILTTEPFHSRTTLSFFLQEGACLATMTELCHLYKRQTRKKGKNPPMNWMYSYSREPNILFDLVFYGSQREGVSQLIVKEFSHQLLQRHHLGPCHTPYDILLEKTILPRQLWSISFRGVDCLSDPPSFFEFKLIVKEMLVQLPSMLDHVSPKGFPDQVMKLDQCENHSTVPPGLINYLFDRFLERPAGLTTVDLTKTIKEHRELGDLIMTVDHVQTIRRVLPSLKKFRSVPEIMEPPAYRSLIRALFLASQETVLPLKDFSL